MLVTLTLLPHCGRLARDPNLHWGSVRCGRYFVIYPLFCGFTSPLLSLSLSGAGNFKCSCCRCFCCCCCCWFFKKSMAGWAYRDVAARRSVTEILKHFFTSFFSRCCCCCLCHRLSAILLAVLASDFSVFAVFFSLLLLLLLLTCCPKSRVEKFTQRSVANEFPLLRHWAWA